MFARILLGTAIAPVGANVLDANVRTAEIRPSMFASLSTGVKDVTKGEEKKMCDAVKGITASAKACKVKTSTFNKATSAATGKCEKLCSTNASGSGHDKACSDQGGSPINEAACLKAPGCTWTQNDSGHPSCKQHGTDAWKCSKTAATTKDDCELDGDCEWHAAVVKPTDAATCLASKPADDKVKDDHQCRQTTVTFDATVDGKGKCAKKCKGNTSGTGEDKHCAQTGGTAIDAAKCKKEKGCEWLAGAAGEGGHDQCKQRTAWGACSVEGLLGTHDPADSSGNALTQSTCEVDGNCIWSASGGDKDTTSGKSGSKKADLKTAVENTCKACFPVVKKPASFANARSATGALALGLLTLFV